MIKAWLFQEAFEEQMQMAPVRGVLWTYGSSGLAEPKRIYIWMECNLFADLASKWSFLVIMMDTELNERYDEYSD